MKEWSKTMHSDVQDELACQWAENVHFDGIIFSFKATGDSCNCRLALKMSGVHVCVEG